MTDNVAILQGYTEEVYAESLEHGLNLLIKPDTDLDDCFKAWDTDGQEFVRINGWMFTIERNSNHD